MYSQVHGVDDQIAILGSGNQGARTELSFLPFS
jgi:hypothetical protein